MNVSLLFISCIGYSTDDEKDQVTNADKDDDGDSVKSHDGRVHRRRMMHKTSSIFLRNLAPSITKQEVEAVSLCQNWFCAS